MNDVEHRHWIPQAPGAPSSAEGGDGEVEGVFFGDSAGK